MSDDLLRRLRAAGYVKFIWYSYETYDEIIEFLLDKIDDLEEEMDDIATQRDDENLQ